MKTTLRPCLILLLCIGLGVSAFGQAIPVKDDPLLRMPGTQPGQGVSLEGPNRCLNCHGDYNAAVEPGFNWKGSMMAQAARDPIFYACLTVAAQDSIWALGNANATDLCIRCHSPAGWLGGRSDPTNMSALTGDDFDGLSCDVCHAMWDPFFETTHSGAREGNDWTGYWDEATGASQTAADATYADDSVLATGIKLFWDGSNFFANKLPKYASTYTENTSGQYFASGAGQKRASFQDADARHQMLYSRHHKSKYFCGTCHDVSNPVLFNLGLGSHPDLSGGADLMTEQYAAHRYFHVERTFSEFMLSAYGRQGGAATNPEFQAQGAPTVQWAAKCQDCHMRDVVGVAANKNGSVLRPDGSTEHPNSGLPLHDMTGGNLWISRILASLDPNTPYHDPVNLQLLDQGPNVLTLDLSAGQSPKTNGPALKAGADRAREQLRLAATIKNLTYDPATGHLSFRIQNNTGHKLISGFPEGRRMFANVRAYSSGVLSYEVNPYDMSVGTLKGLEHAPSSPALGAAEAYVDELVYEVHPSSDLTGEEHTFHFVLATGRSKDNRIPPKGFDISAATTRLAEPIDDGLSAPGYFTSEEYAGGYDEVDLTIATGADTVEIVLYYQGTSREYVEFLRDEIKGNASTLSSPTPVGAANAYVIQSDPFFDKLRAWGDVIWQLWYHNHGLDGSGRQVEGIVPFAMAEATWGGGPAPCTAPVPQLLEALPGHSQVTLAWSEEHLADSAVVGYQVFYDQSGKSQLIAELGQLSTFTDSGLTNGQTYCYKVVSLYDSTGDGNADCSSGYSNILCATPTTQGQTQAGVSSLQTGWYDVVGQGNRKVQTFVATNTFTAGQSIVIRALIVDRATGLPLSGATASLQLSGPQSASLTTSSSNADGIAEANWNTQLGNKRGIGSTPPGTYTVTTAGVSAPSHSWDGVATSTTFIIQ